MYSNLITTQQIALEIVKIDAPSSPHPWDMWSSVNTLRQRQNGHHFADDIFKCIFLNENLWILIKISLKFVPKGSINNIPALLQVMAWRRPGDKPLTEPMVVRLLMHICVTRPQWVKALHLFLSMDQQGLTHWTLGDFN